MFYHARYYAPYLNRFIQADTIVPQLENPQSLNRYSYVNNRPLVYIDPSGHIPGGPRPFVDPMREVLKEWASQMVLAGESYDPDAWISGFIRGNREMIIETANRHHLQPEFLAAVLYLENSHWMEQLVQSLPAGESLQQAVKFLWNKTFQTQALEGDFLHTGGDWKYTYFKLGRSQGIGAIVESHKIVPGKVS
jgi:hypothetical protein